MYVSIQRRRPINSGFFIGPFIPVYGFGALLVLISEVLLKDIIPLAIRLLLYTLIATAIEYYASLILEEIFHIKLWDYSDNFLNMHGRICFLYSAYWFLLSFLLLAYIHPTIKAAVSFVPRRYLFYINFILTVYILTDLFYSAKALNKFIKAAEQIRHVFIGASKPYIDTLLSSSLRLRKAFPNLKLYLNRRITENLKNAVVKPPKDILPNTGINYNVRHYMEEIQKIKSKRMESLRQIIEKPKYDKDYYNIVADILNNKKFQKLKDYKHHDESIMHHVKAVSYISYDLAKKLNLNAGSAARGALLHDFFLYDWRTTRIEKSGKKKLHGFIHPHIALDNAEIQFTLSDIERDIILNHMWPLTFRVPKYKETFLVSFIDKTVSTREFLSDLSFPSFGGIKPKKN